MKKYLLTLALLLASASQVLSQGIATLTWPGSPGPLSLGYGTINIAPPSPNGFVTVTNTGSSNLDFQNYTITGDFGLNFGAGGNCPFPQGSLSAGNSCTIGISFIPTTLGQRSGILTVFDDSGGVFTSQTVSVVGIGAGPPGGVITDWGGQVGPSAHYAVVTWTASTSSGVTGYRIWRSQFSGSGYVVVGVVSGSTLTWTDNQLYSGNAYFYVVTTLATGLGESGFSNEVVAVIPSP